MHSWQRKIEFIWANLFFVFFIAQILSPSIGDKTIYLEWCIALLNPFFWIWIVNKKMSWNFLAIIACLGCVAAIHPITAIKLIMNFFGICYLGYLYSNNLFFINIYLCVSIVVGIMQFIFLSLGNTEALNMITPTSIAETVWGSYATPTFANFYDIGIGIPRFSGLSREAGFFAALIQTGILFNYLSSNREGKVYLNKYKVIHFIGYVISFSKISLAIFLAFFIDKIRRYINYLPSVLMIAILLITASYWGMSHTSFLLDNENVTFLDRFGAYAAFFDLNLSQFFLGVDLNRIESFVADAELYSTPNLWFAGFAGWIIYNGVIVLGLWCLILYLMGITTSGILMLIILTLNVQPDTNQNFVVLAYFIVWKYYQSVDCQAKCNTFEK